MYMASSLLLGLVSLVGFSYSFLPECAQNSATPSPPARGHIQPTVELPELSSISISLPSGPPEVGHGHMTDFNQ